MCILDAIHNEQKLNKCRKCNSTEEKAACLRVCFKISPLITVLFQSLISITAFLLRGRLIVPGVLQITDKRHNKSNKSIPQRKAPSVTAQTHWPISLRVTLTLCVCVCVLQGFGVNVQNCAMVKKICLGINKVEEYRDGGKLNSKS